MTSPNAPTPTATPTPTPASTTPHTTLRTAVITGAARGIGQALAISLAQRGIRVALVGLEPHELDQTAKDCREHTEARAWTADVTDLTSLTTIAAEIKTFFGSIDIVVANAGIAIGGPFVDSDPASFNRVIDVNLLGSIATARAFLPHLLDSRGYLLQIASLAAMAPAPLMAAYCASKSGVEAFAHCLRAEVAHQGVDVGIAYLTWTDTDMVRAADEDPVLGQMRASLPWPGNRTAPLAPAVARLTKGIERRSAHVYAQPWIRTVQWLPRLALPTTIARQGAKQVARLAPSLAATAAQRLHPVGPGGRAAETRPTTPPTPEPPPPTTRTSAPDAQP